MSWLTGTWSLPTAVVVLAGASAAIAVFGSRLARVVDHLADRTGMGEALAGSILLAGATSIAGLVVSVVAAAEENASLAVSNSLGGIAAQTAFIVVADLAYRRANIEHAAASLTNLFNAFLLVALLSIVLMGVAGPDWAVLDIHVATPVLVFVYAYGLRLSRTVGAEKMWIPRRTVETRIDEPGEEGQQASLRDLVVGFAGLAAVVTVAGYAVARAGISLIEATGLGGTAVGVFFTSISSSLPELVTAVAAVRAGALTLAVAGIVGGNALDVLFIAVADVVFRDGSIYGAVAAADVFVLGWTLVLVAILGAGLVRRQRGGIGFEGISILVFYAAGLAAVTIVD